MTDPVLLCAPPADGAVAKALELVGAVARDHTVARGSELPISDGVALAGAIIDATAIPFNDAIGLCRQLRARKLAVAPVLLVLDRYQLDELALREDLFDDFVLSPVDVVELAARLRVRLRRAGHRAGSPVIEHAGLHVNLETYQATIDGRPLDLTFMEYELLRFLAANPGRVFTRKTLLSRVWGYEYYGGTRTVDVHVRRLRAKLGEEHASLIQTVRSVGYRFGSPGHSN